MEFKEDDFLQLSGIQHYVFCKRQWALIHIENQWAENERTVDGQFFHKRAHDGFNVEKRGDIIVSRGLYIHSRSLGFSGQCDIVEFHKDDNGVTMHGYDGKWIPYPIEYKRGKKKFTIEDISQVCAQAICLEEMYCCEIKEGAIFYGENRRRQVIEFDDNIRNEVKKIAKEMHDVFSRGYTPKVKYTKKCDMCSLKENCLPELNNKESVESYMKRMVQE